MMDNECHNIDVSVQHLETTLHDTLEVHALLITKSVTFRYKCPWFSGTIKQQKRIDNMKEYGKSIKKTTNGMPIGMQKRNIIPC